MKLYKVIFSYRPIGLDTPSKDILITQVEAFDEKDALHKAQMQILDNPDTFMWSRAALLTNAFPVSA